MTFDQLTCLTLWSLDWNFFKPFKNFGSTEKEDFSSTEKEDFWLSEKRLLINWKRLLINWEGGLLINWKGGLIDQLTKVAKTVDQLTKVAKTVDQLKFFFDLHVLIWSSEIRSSDPLSGFSLLSWKFHCLLSLFFCYFLVEIDYTFTLEKYGNLA